MAAGGIRVCVLEGICAKMTELDLPLSLAVKLQYRGLHLDSSLWTAHLSNGGYSVSFFGPHSIAALGATGSEGSQSPATSQSLHRI